jgi:WhiB family redox-sensing transcriptional regulator
LAKLVLSAWRKQAECAWWTTDDPARDPFFPNPGQRPSLAKFICDGCPVKQECLDEAMAEEYGLPRNLRFGVRGGLSRDERTLLAKARGEIERQDEDDFWEDVA